MKLIIITLLVVTYLLGAEGSQVYGPADWGHVSEDCNGYAQSPIDINQDDVEDSDDLSPLTVKYDNAKRGRVTGTLINNGHAPTLSIDQLKGTAILTNPLNNERYKLVQFHFHFGCEDGIGSEHTVNAKRYSGEVHMVTYNTKYDNFESAVTKPDGLAVIGVFLKKKRKGNRELTKLGKSMEKIVAEGATKDNVVVSVVRLLRGVRKSAYYTYKGSLTTPGCYESVRWLVMKNPIAVNGKTLKHFRNLQASHGYHHGKMCNNFRNTHPLNGRKISQPRP